MLRIHFTDADLARVQVATAPDPLWETVLGLHQLSGTAVGSSAAPVFTHWRHRARAELTGRRLAGSVHLLGRLAPPDAPYFPDFLTPAEASRGIGPGLDAVRATPQGQLHQELSRLTASLASARRPSGAPARRPRPPAGGPQFLPRVGGPQFLQRVAGALHAVYATVIEPDWSLMAVHVEADRALRLRALRDGGVRGLLESLRPFARWRPPVLRLPYPVDRDVHLRGRGLRLVPSRFCWRTPVTLVDPALPPVLVYPVAQDEAPATGGGHGRQPAALQNLLGATRARVLTALRATGTTGELAVRLGISPASASKHARALREAQLITSRRTGGMVVHTLTPLGSALLSGQLPVR